MQPSRNDFLRLLFRPVKHYQENNRHMDGSNFRIPEDMAIGRNTMHSSAYKWIVLGTVSMATFSATLDMSIIVVSFPRLVDLFHTDASTVVWLAIAFSIAELGLLLTLAKVGDTVGRKKVFIIGLSIYTVGLIFCSISGDISQLILSRVVQGAGAAMAITVGGAIVVAVFPREQQGRAIGIFSMMMTVGLIAGPPLGGVILDSLDWQGIFYTRIPIGVICLILTMIIIKEQKEEGTRLQLDIGGAVTLLVGTGCLLLFLNLGSDWGYLSLKSLVLVLVAAACLGLFFYFELKVPQPVLDLSLFKNRVFSMASASNIIQMSAGVACPTLLPFFLIGGLLFSPSRVGLLMAIIAVPHAVFSPISGWLSDKIGFRIPMVVAMCLLSLSLFLASHFHMDSSVSHISIVLLMFGTSLGLFMAPNQSAIVGAAPRKNLATAMGVANTVRLLGASIGTAGVGTLFASRQAFHKAGLAAQGTAPDLVDRLAVVESFQSVLFMAAVLCTAAILTSLFAGGRTKTGSPQSH